MNWITIAAIWIAAIGTGIMAGIYFAFSSFVMKSLAVIETEKGIIAMQSINKVILSSSFMPLFIGTSLLSFGLLILGCFRWDNPLATTLVAASLIYLIGMFACTAFGNVPLNETLDKLNPSSVEAAQFWNTYLRIWTRYNHVRTIASIIACLLYIKATSY